MGAASPGTANSAVRHPDRTALDPAHPIAAGRFPILAERLHHSDARLWADAVGTVRSNVQESLVFR
jgi:hypothetical protein